MDRNNLNYLVYVHTNKINGKKYVGQSSNIVERWRNGGKNYFSSIKFFRAIQKYGWENFTHEISIPPNRKPRNYKPTQKICESK